MKPSKLYEALHALIGERVPLHIWGACGVGKSQIVAQVADDLDFEFLDVRAVQLDPVDLRGLPRIKADQTEWVPPKFLPTTGKGILFLDELTSAPQMTQAGCYQLVLDRKLGEYVLPDGWVVIAAGNPASERGVHFSMPRPLRNRFVHLSLDADLNDWCKWAVYTDKDHQWHMQILGKLAQADPELLLATPHKVVNLQEPEAVATAVAWWQELTASGGEGMVVKPLQFVARNKRGLIQPAVKCRGTEYVRIIYGPEYTAPQNLERLRSRGLGTKRSLALREFALGVEALQRFVEHEPLRRVHECAFAVLALESEPVDPRL